MLYGFARYNVFIEDILVLSTHEKMQVSAPNNIKIYNLSAGKSIPEVRTPIT